MNEPTREGWQNELAALIRQTGEHVGVPPLSDPLGGRALLAGGSYVHLPADGRLPLVVARDGGALRADRAAPESARTWLSSAALPGEGPLEPGFQTTPPLHPTHLALRYPGRVTHPHPDDEDAVLITFGDTQITVALAPESDQAVMIVAGYGVWQSRPPWAVVLRLVLAEVRVRERAARAAGDFEPDALDALDAELAALEAEWALISPADGLIDLCRALTPDAHPLPATVGMERLHEQVWLAIACWAARRGHRHAPAPAVVAEAGLERRDGLWTVANPAGMLECRQHDELALVHGVVADQHGQPVPGWTALDGPQLDALRKTLIELPTAPREDQHPLREYVASILSSPPPGAFSPLELLGRGASPAVSTLGAGDLRGDLLEYVHALGIAGADVLDVASAELDQLQRDGVQTRRAASDCLVGFAGSGFPLVELHVALADRTGAPGDADTVGADPSAVPLGAGVMDGADMVVPDPSALPALPGVAIVGSQGWKVPTPRRSRAPRPRSRRSGATPATAQPAG